MNAPVFNLQDPAFISNPYPAYKFLRTTAPVWRSPLGFWLLTRYDDIAQTLKDPNFIHDFDGEISDPANRVALRDEPVIASLRRSMLVRDPPDHTRLRGLVAKAFTARRMEELRPRIESIVKELLDGVIPRGHMDVIADFSHKLPVIVICDLLGIPEHDRHLFINGVYISGRAIEIGPMTPDQLREANESTLKNKQYFESLFVERRENPGDDLISALLQIHDESNSRLSNDELTANIGLLFSAGHETTSNQIANGVLGMHTHPEQWRRLVADPSLAATAAEETLRYDSSVQLTVRKASRDCQIGGQNISRGEVVICLLGAANRDPAKFPNPDQFDLSRVGERPISFGGGIHHCLGAQLARIEIEVALRELAKRIPNMEIENLDSPQWRPTLTLRRLAKLSARWPVGAS